MNDHGEIRKADVQRIVKGVLLAIATFCLLEFVTIELTLEFLTPKEALFPVIATSLVIILAGGLVYFRYIHLPQKDSNPERRFKPKKWQVYLGFLACIAIIIAVTAISTALINCDIERLVPIAHQHYTIILADNISEYPRDYTIAQIERQYPKLRSLYLPEAAWPSRLRVQLYSNTDSLQRLLNTKGWVWGNFGFAGDVPIVNIPCDESVPNINHELMHAMTGELLGQVKMRDTPRWFIEGLAEYKSRERQKMDGRLDLLFNKSTLSDYEEFNSYVANDDNIARTVFYNKSFELLVYINSRFGEDSISSILKSMADGSDFNSAVSVTTHQTPKGLYDSWTKAFY
jgi:hypothetical protein